MSTRKRAKDLWIETLIGALWVVVVLAYASMRPGDKSLPWTLILFILYTAVVFGYPVSQFRGVLENWLFWTTLSTLLLFHIMAFALAFSRIHSPALGYYGLLAPIEAGLVMFVVGKVVPKGNN